MIVDGKLSLEAAARRQIALSTAREVCACVARGMITECGRAVRVLPVEAVVPVDGEAEDGEAEDCGDLTAKGAKGREGGAA
jgi:hypothetical protein